MIDRAGQNLVLEVALGYLADGWSVFPVCTPIISRAGYCMQHGQCQKAGKAPLVKWGVFQDEAPSEAQVREWWHRWPGANIALATGELSGVVVVDLDGDVAVKEAARRGYDPGPWVKTGRVGGRHLYFQYRDDAPTIFAKAIGIDFKGQGGYVLLPPSLHASGAHYLWGDPVQRGEPLPVLPRWVDELARMSNDGEPRKKVDFGRLFREGIAAGERDQELFRLACKMRGVGVQYDVAVHMLLTIPLEQGTEPFTTEEVKAKVDSAYGRYVPNDTSGIDPDDEINAADLVQADLPEPRWAVEGLWPEGVVLLAGKTKLGKSWLALDAALAIAEGGNAWGLTEVEQGDVLYLALEDSKRRLQDRLQLLRGGNAPAALTFRIRAPRADEGGIDMILDWLNRHPRARMVIIDVLGKFRPREINAKRLYDHDYEAIAPIADLARTRGVSVVVVHHCNKALHDDPVDAVSGTTGLVGAADAVCVFRRERGKADASLLVTGRDVEEHEIAFKNLLREGSGSAWGYVGEASETRMSQARQEIIDVLTSMGSGMRPVEISAAIRKNSQTTRSLLFDMVRAGQVREQDSHYYPGFSIQNNGNGGNGMGVSQAVPVTTVPAVPVVHGVTPVSVPSQDRGMRCSGCGRIMSIHHVCEGRK